MKTKSRLINKTWIWIILAVSSMGSLLLAISLWDLSFSMEGVEDRLQFVATIFVQSFFGISLLLTGSWLIIAIIITLGRAVKEIYKSGFKDGSWQTLRLPISLACFFAVGIFTVNQAQYHIKHQAESARHIREHCRECRVTKLPSDVRTLLEEPNNFSSIKTAKLLPKSVISLFVSDFDGLAEPGEDWQVTDLIIDAKLPFKRLIWAAKKNDIYVVHYEEGGMGYSCHILVAKLENGRAKIIWHGVGVWLENFGLLGNALLKNKFDDQLPYAP
jgi:hypothetical protein